ncbi:hypothetical protein EJB05_39036, partial [Eragrostis curvula]
MTNFISICIVVVVICTMGRTILVSGFDLTDSADHVKDLLERIAGIGTIFALKLRPPKKVTTTSKAFAVVQFDTEKSASLVESAAQRNVLRNGRFYLKVRPADRDIVPRPKTTMFSLEDTVLHFGCLVKENVLHVLWSAKEVSVKFGFDMKKIQFYLIYNFIKYKLELSYESIWDMKLYRPPAHRSRTKFLLIQVGMTQMINGPEQLILRHQLASVNRLCYVWRCHSSVISQTLVTTFFTTRSSMMILNVIRGIHIPVAHALFLVSGFDLTDSADHVKDLLERIAGIGTIFALKLRPPKKVTTTSKAFAVVQFDTEKSASLVESAAQRNVLRNGRFYLKVRLADRDIVPRPKTTMFSLEDTVLHFGCLVKENVLHVLWSAKEVSVKFGFDMKKIQFYLIYNFIKYKLELSYESIWDMKLYRPPAHRSRTKFLLIQVQAVPKIYEALPSLSGLMYDDPIYNYFRDDTDDQWTRTIDFTPSASIGQSTMLCLEVPQQCDLPNIGDYFFYHKEFNDDFECHKGYSYSCGTRIVPVVKSPNDIDVPYEILFKINNMVQIGTLSGPTLDADFFRLVSQKFIPMDHINHALSEMSELKRTCLNPTNWLSLHYSNSLNLCSSFSKSSQISLDDGLVYVHRVQVTPAKVYFYEPEINVSNRVVRKYLADIDNFLRVSFVDEDCEKLRSVDLSPRSVSGNNSRRTALYYRVLSVLSDGITIGDKHFEFLAFSSSQLRDNSTWMFASREGLTASDIRKWMGDFRKIRNVAKYAARLDITNGTRYIFSDGIGKISADFAMEVAMKCKVKRFTPSAFQIRYGGYKGVVAVDPRSNPSKLLELKTKSRIFIPSGRAMMGCLDETRTLKYGQADVIFICLVRPLLSKLFSNLVVCACRSHPNECSGSDLDGDIYFVSWDQSLIPTRMVAPMDYSPAPTETLDHEVMIEVDVDK